MVRSFYLGMALHHHRLSRCLWIYLPVDYFCFLGSQFVSHLFPGEPPRGGEYSFG